MAFVQLHWMDMTMYDSGVTWRTVQSIVDHEADR